MRHDTAGDPVSGIKWTRPYGIYDTQANRGSVFLGTSHDTPAFAVDAFSQWWLQEGSQRYPAATELFILADGGGSNGSRCRAWKKALQETICIRLGLTVTVCHYPPGTSKWNPIEHRLFSQISRNRAGEPLTDIDTALHFIRTTYHHEARSRRHRPVDRRYYVKSRRAKSRTQKCN